MAVPPELPPRTDADGSDDGWQFETLTDLENPRADSAGPSLLQEGDLLLQRFKVIRLVGSGGMGEVYEARDQRLQVTVALKTIRASRATDAALVERLRREVSLARGVSHPNVCRVFDLHETNSAAGPVLFISMEYLDGETLSHRLRRAGPLSVSEALGLLRQAAAGLTAIHAAGLVHRDLKPGNILLVPEGGSVRLVVTDFGLARPLVARSSDGGWDRNETRPLRGSPSYMSPEQRAAAEVTPRSDLYALGLIAHAIVTGVAPVAGRLGKTPRGWRRHLRKALQEDPAKRFATPNQLVAALSGHPQGRRVTWAVLGLMLVALAGVSGLIGRVFRSVALPADSALPAPLSRSDPASGEGGTANSKAYDHYLRGLYWADRWQMVPENRKAMSEFEQAVALDPRYALAHAQLGLAYARDFLISGNHDESLVQKAKAEADQALELAPGIGVPHLIRSELSFTAQGNWDFESAIAEAQKATPREPQLAHQQLAKLYTVMGIEDPAIREATMAVAMNSTPSAQYNLLVALSFTGNWSEAIARARMASFPNYLQTPTNLARLRTGAISELEEASDKAPHMESAIALALVGKRDEADAEARAAMAKFDVGRRSYYSDQYDVACFDAVMGRKDEAVRWLRLAAGNGFPNYLLFSRDPLPEQIRTQAGYLNLMASLKPRWERWRMLYQ